MYPETPHKIENGVLRGAINDALATAALEMGYSAEDSFETFYEWLKCVCEPSNTREGLTIYILHNNCIPPVHEIIFHSTSETKGYIAR